jgi:hypothetical protein
MHHQLIALLDKNRSLPQRSLQDRGEGYFVRELAC